MKKVKVSIQDENTLILLEDAQKGDLIDLKSIHEADIDKTSIEALSNRLKPRNSMRNLKLQNKILPNKRSLKQSSKPKISLPKRMKN